MAHIGIVYDSLLEPAYSGDRIRVRELCHALQRRGHTVHWLFPGYIDSPSRQYCHSHGIVTHSFSGPKGGGGRSTYALLRNTYHRFKRLPFIDTVRGLYLRYRPSENFWHRYPEGFADFVGTVVRQNGISTLFVEYVWMWRSIESLPPHVHTILDTHDIQYVRQEQFRALNRHFPIPITKDAEVAIWERFHTVIAIQAKEQTTIKQDSPGSSVIRVGLVGEGTYVTPAPSKRLLLVGGANALNRQSFAWFLTDVWPHIRAQHPEAEVMVAGAVCDYLKAGPGVRLLGFVSDLRDLYSSVVLVINPVLAGTGLKIKTVEALSFGQALVGTEVAVEGMVPGVHQAAKIVSAGEFAPVITQLLGHPEQLAGLRAAARAYHQKHYGYDATYGELYALLTPTP